MTRTYLIIISFRYIGREHRYGYEVVITEHLHEIGWIGVEEFTASDNRTPPTIAMIQRVNHHNQIVITWLHRNGPGRTLGWPSEISSIVDWLYRFVKLDQDRVYSLELFRIRPDPARSTKHICSVLCHGPTPSIPPSPTSIAQSGPAIWLFIDFQPEIYQTQYCCQWQRRSDVQPTASIDNVRPTSRGGINMTVNRVQ